MFTCASTVYMYFCNLLTELNVPPLVVTSLLNHFEDFVKARNLSFNTSFTDPFFVPTDSHLQELPDPGITWEQTLSIFNKKFFGEVSTAGILVLLTHCHLGTSAKAQPVVWLPQVPLTGLPEPFHARSSWIWAVALGFSLVKTTLLCPWDSVNRTLFIFWTGMVTPSDTVIWLYTTNLSFFRKPWQDFPWRPSNANFRTSLHVPVRPTA